MSFPQEYWETLMESAGAWALPGKALSPHVTCV
jgi:hypothetical protein